MVVPAECTHGIWQQVLRPHVQAHSDSIEFICAIQKTLMYVCMYKYKY